MTDAPENEVNEVDETVTQTPVEQLLAKIAQRDQLSAEIETDMTTLGMDAKKLKEVIKAQKAKAAADKTLAALMGL